MVVQLNHLGKFACACAFKRQIDSLCLSLLLHKRAQRQSFPCVCVSVAPLHGVHLNTQDVHLTFDFTGHKVAKTRILSKWLTKWTHLCCVLSLF